MLWYGRFSWYPGTTTTQVRERVAQGAASGPNSPAKIHGWYKLATGGTGFLLIEAGDRGELHGILEPYVDLMTWDVHAVYPLDYQATIRRGRSENELLGIGA